MFIEILQFWLSHNIFGNFGLKPSTAYKSKIVASDSDIKNAFALLQLGLTGILTTLGLLWILNALVSKFFNGKIVIFSFVSEN